MALDKIIQEKFPKEFKELSSDEKEFLCEYTWEKDESFEKYQQVVTKLLNLDKHATAPRHFLDNLLNSEKIKTPKLEFGNNYHIAIADGFTEFPSKWYK